MDCAGLTLGSGDNSVTSLSSQFTHAHFLPYPSISPLKVRKSPPPYYTMDSPEETRAVFSMFAGSHHQSLHSPEFKVAGRDLFTSTVAPTINLSFGLAHAMVSKEHPNDSQSVLPLTRGPAPPPQRTHGRSTLAQLIIALRRLVLQDSVVPSNAEPQQTEIHTLNEGLDESPAFLTTPDVYVLNMLRTGKGLACWQPRPWKPLASKCGTVPGDVGIFAAESGFKKLFNLWDDDEAVRNTGRRHCSTTYRLPERNVVVAEALGRGDAVAQGTSSMTSWTDDGHTIKNFEFECRSSQGAVLAITSPADLEEIADHTALREHIVHNAESLYRHASTICRIASKEALYIITGCIKSESWALAAFNDPTTSSADVLRLMKRPGADYPSPEFMWTHRATSEARVGRGEVLGTKDQSLFLRGFKLDFSEAFRARMDSLKLSMRSADPEDSRSSSDASSSVGSMDTSPGGTGSPYASINSSSRSSGGQAGSGSSVLNFQGPLQGNRIDEGQIRSDSGSQEIRVTSLAQTSHYHSYHPCDLINKCVLENTNANFALSHDDDWRGLLQHFDGDGDSDGYETSGKEANSIDHCVSHHNGVACFNLSAVVAKEDSEMSSPISSTTRSTCPIDGTLGQDYDVGFDSDSAVLDEVSRTPRHSKSTHASRFQPQTDAGDSSQSEEVLSADPRDHLSPFQRHSSASSGMDVQDVADSPAYARKRGGTDAKAFDSSGVSQSRPDPEEEYLRQKLALRSGEPISLWSLPDPEPGQRPPHSYPLLVRLAIFGSPKKQLTLKQIYDAIEERFEYYRNRPKGAWKGSIRHNLSLNQVFKNVPQSLTEPGKGNYWEIDHSRGEGYKRDRKCKSGRTMTGDDSRGRSNEDEYAYGDLSGCELEMGMLDSDQPDILGNHASASSVTVPRPASPYPSPSAPIRELKPSRHGVPSSVPDNEPAVQTALTRALDLAREAVQLDSSNDSPEAAVQVYGQTVALLSEVIQMVEKGRDRSATWEEDKIRRLHNTHDIYTERMAVLRSVYNIAEAPPPYPTAPPTYISLSVDDSQQLPPPSYDDVLSQLQKCAVYALDLPRGVHPVTASHV